MRKGISPVIAVVLLIAISVVAAVGVWYWVAELGAKPSGIGSTPQATISIEDCDLNNERVRVRNTGGVIVTQNVSIYGPKGEIGTIAFEIHRLDTKEIRYIPINLHENETLESGTEYEVIGDLPVVTFTC